MNKTRIISVLAIVLSIINICTSFPISEKDNIVETASLEFPPTIMEITNEYINTLDSLEELTDEVIVDKQYNEDDLYWLSRIISAESRGESEEGQIAVGNVVMNRVKSDKFPNTIKEVIFQKGQFSPVNNGSVHGTPTQKSLESAMKVLDGQVVVSNEALYFYSPKYTSKSNWIRSRVVLIEIGTHRFAK